MAKTKGLMEKASELKTGAAKATEQKKQFERTPTDLTRAIDHILEVEKKVRVDVDNFTVGQDEAGLRESIRLLVKYIINAPYPTAGNAAGNFADEYFRMQMMKNLFGQGKGDPAREGE